MRSENAFIYKADFDLKIFSPGHPNHSRHAEMGAVSKGDLASKAPKFSERFEAEKKSPPKRA